ncbi:MAG TPA: type II secretion system F family protein [Candidatus Dormibacteraeota bacterium]
MLEAAAAGVGVTTAVLALLLPVNGSNRSRLLRRLDARWEREVALAAATGWKRVDALRLTGAQLAAGGLAALCGAVITGLPALVIVAFVAGIAGVRLTALMRAAALRRSRQDAVLEAVRLLRQLLETGGVGVQQGLAVLADRGPEGLREEFSRIVAAGTTGRQAEAWQAAKTRLAEPVFDLLAAAIAVQRPAGGRLGPLFADVEESVTALYEVVREGEALQVQARSTAIFILALPIGFLTFLAALHSSYLDVYRQPAGELFLIGVLGVMGASYLWVRRLLALPPPPRLRLSDG